MRPDTITRARAPVNPSIGAAYNCARFAVDELAHALGDPKLSTLPEAVRYLETALRKARDAQAAQTQEPVA